MKNLVMALLLAFIGCFAACTTDSEVLTEAGTVDETGVTHRAITPAEGFALDKAIAEQLGGPVYDPRGGRTLADCQTSDSCEPQRNDCFTETLCCIRLPVMTCCWVEATTRRGGNIDGGLQCEPTGPISPNNPPEEP